MKLQCSLSIAHHFVLHQLFHVPDIEDIRNILLPPKCTSVHVHNEPINLTTEELLELSLSLELVNLALQHVYPVVLECLLDPGLCFGILRNSPRCRCGSCQKTDLTTQEETANGEEEVSCGIAPSRGA